MNRDNTVNRTPGALRGVGVGALMLGVLGLATCWWTPMGLVLSLAGLITGFAAWTMARRQSQDARLSMAAMAVSLVALVIAGVIAGFGWQLWTFGGY